MYETDAKILPHLVNIFKLLDLGAVSPMRIPMTNQPPQTNTIFTMNNIYLLHLLCTIVKRLVKIAVDH